MINFPKITVVTENQINIAKERVDSYLNDDLRKLIDAISLFGYDIRIVGGAVRDILIDKTPRDIDIVTTATPEEIIFILSLMDIDSDPWGVAHGTVKAIIGDEKYEISSLAFQMKRDGNKIITHRGSSWESDALRRDFTFNAMSMDLDGNVYDYFDGIKDLKDQRIRPLPGFEEKIINDPVVILRFFRFLSRFVNPIFPQEAFSIILKHKDKIKSISQKRIDRELNNIRSGVSGDRVLDLLRSKNIL